MPIANWSTFVFSNFDDAERWASVSDRTATAVLWSSCFASIRRRWPVSLDRTWRGSWANGDRSRKATRIAVSNCCTAAVWVRNFAWLAVWKIPAKCSRTVFLWTSDRFVRWNSILFLYGRNVEISYLKGRWLARSVKFLKFPVVGACVL